jgi:hypothetical protein
MGRQMESVQSTTEQLIGVIGKDAYSKLQAAQGGQVIQVPATHEAKVFGDLCQIIGQAGTEALIRVFAGDDIYIASGKLAQQIGSAAKRNAAICAEYDTLTKTLTGGEAIRRLSTKHRLSNRWIYMILKRVW